MSDRVLSESKTTLFQRNRRLARVRLSADFLLDLMKRHEPTTYSCTMNALPDDVKAVGASYDVIADCWEFGVTSESFPEVEDAAQPPLLDPPVWTQHIDDAIGSPLAQTLREIKRMADEPMGDETFRGRVEYEVRHALAAHERR